MKIIKTNKSEIIARLNEPVHQIHAELYPEYFKEYNYDDIKEFFDKIIDDEKFIFLVVEEEANAIGYAWIEIKEYRGNAFLKPSKSIYIHQISIVKSHRKKGYGTKLMEEIYDIAKTYKIDQVKLDYWTGNDIAEKFYKKHEYKKYHEFVYKEL